LLKEEPLMSHQGELAPKQKNDTLAAHLIAAERQEALKSHEVYSVSALAYYFEDLCHFDVT